MYDGHSLNLIFSELSEISGLPGKPDNDKEKFIIPDLIGNP